jgi:RNA polymerase sigma-70 factor (ECF subfamily)
MMQPLVTSPSLSIEQLLDHARWAEGFARMLVRDDADDLAQDAWVAALRTPPAAPARPRAWLAGVLRNTARMRFRGDTRRKAREQHDAPPEPPSAQDSLHRMQLQRRLAELVLALDEPRRTAIVLAFYEGKSAAEIGRVLDVPATTVRSRIASALDTMRAQLDEQAAGDRSQWQLALAPLVRMPMPAAAGGISGAAIAAFVACVLLGIGVVAADRLGSTAAAFTPPVTPVEPELPIALVAQAPPPSAAVVTIGKPASTVVVTPTRKSAAPAATKPEPPKTMKDVVERVNATLRERFNECWELAKRDGRDIKGLVAVNITVETTPTLDATLVFDPKNEITDPETLECLRENPLAILEDFEQLIAATGDSGPFTIQVRHPLPPAKQTGDWPGVVHYENGEVHITAKHDDSK